MYYCWRYQLSNTMAPCRQQYTKTGKPIDIFFWSDLDWERDRGWQSGLDLWFGKAGNITNDEIYWFRAGSADRMLFFYQVFVFWRNHSFHGDEPWSVSMLSSNTMIWDGIYQSNSRFTWKTSISDSQYNRLVTSCLRVPHQSAPHRDNQPSKGPSVA